MSETEPIEPEVVEPSTEDAKGLRAEIAKANAAKDAAEAKATDLERKAVFSEAGLELNDAQKAALQAVHKGEWTPDSLKETATALGFSAVSQEAPVVNQQEAESLARVSSLGAGAEPAAPSDEQERRMNSWSGLGKSMSEDAFYNEVKDTIPADFFEQHRQKLVN